MEQGNETTVTKDLFLSLIHISSEGTEGTFCGDDLRDYRPENQFHHELGSHHGAGGWTDDRLRDASGADGDV